MAESEEVMTEAFDLYKQTHVLTTRLDIDVALGDVTEEPFLSFFREDMRLLKKYVARFEGEVWFGSLQKYLLASPMRAHKAKVGGVDVLVCTIVGRTMITIENEICSITLMTHETVTEPGKMGIKSLEGEVDHLLFLFFRVLGQVLVFHEDEDIGIG